MPPGASNTPNPINTGGGKPKPTQKLGEGEFNKDSNLAQEPNRQGSDEQGGPQEAERDTPSKGGKAVDRGKDLAANASETVKDVQDVAKAGPTGLETSAQEIKEGKDKGGAKGAAGAAGREAAGQAVAGAADVLSGGATAKAHGKIAKGVSKGLKKENLKKVALSIGIIISIPAIFIGIIVGVLLYAAIDPYKFVSQVLTDPKVREFAAQAASLTGKTFLGRQDDVLKQYGYVENNSGTAIAQTSSPTPKPGSLAEKLTKINIKNAVYQTNAKPSCPYTFTYKDMVGPNGQQTSVIDKTYNSKGEEVNSDNFVVNYCIAQSMPLYNLMVRVDKGQEVNKFSNTVLNYAAQPDSLKDKSYKEISDYVYDKTYNRITSKPEDDPKVENENVAEYITNVRKALEEGDDPYEVDSDFQFKPGFDTDDKKTISTMCTFTQGYLNPENIRQGILARLNTGQRSGMKSNTLSSTRHLGLMSNEEVGPTFKQLENWAASRAYHQNVYGTQAGEAINPESLSNTSYGAGYDIALSIMFDTKDACDDLSEGGIFERIVGKGDTKALADIKADYFALQKIIINQSNGKFTNPKDFGLQQLMVGIIRMSGGSAVSGLEPGPWNFNNQSQGFRGLSNQYMLRMGGRFLTAEEANKLSNIAENTRRDIEEKNGLAYRLFGKDNIRSLANVIQYETPKTSGELNSKTKEYIAKISNPVKIIADIHSSFSYIASGKINRAFAANATGDAYMRLDTIGLPQEDFEGVDLIKNSDEIQNIQANGTEDQKKILGYFDQCSKSNIPSRYLFMRRFKVNDGARVDVKSELTVSTDDNPKTFYPYYPAMADKIESTETLKEEKKAWMACEIYLAANPDDSRTSGSTISLDQREKLFGVREIEDLAKKYRLYLYSNSMADLMVELSSTEENKNIYANPSGESGTTTNTSGEIGPDVDTSNFPTPEGTTEVGIFQDYGPGQVPTVKIKVVNITGYSLKVNASIGAQVKQLLDSAKADGVNLDGGGFRSYESQVALRKAHCADWQNTPSNKCRPPTAKAGNSMHEVGLAIDFTQNGSTIGSGSTGFAWLKQNAERFGLKNLPSEPWHWSTNGS